MEGGRREGAGGEASLEGDRLGAFLGEGIAALLEQDVWRDRAEEVWIPRMHNTGRMVDCGAPDEGGMTRVEGEYVTCKKLAAREQYGNLG